VIGAAALAAHCGIVVNMRWPTVCLVAVSLLGCGDPVELPDVSVGVAVSWKFAPPSLNELGFTMSVLVTQRPPRDAMQCRQLPTSARFTIDGQDVTALGTTPDGCFDLRFTKGPFLDFDNAPVTVRYEEYGRQIGEGVFRDLAPGTMATLAVPASGEAHPGEQITILPPPAMPTSLPGAASFFPLDAPASATWQRYGVTTSTTRSADGIHVTVPQMAGRAAVWMIGMPYSPHAQFTCVGFQLCTTITDNSLGPVLLTVVP
jgi:hypothetical protein